MDSNDQQENESNENSDALRSSEGESPESKSPERAGPEIPDDGPSCSYSNSRGLSRPDITRPTSPETRPSCSSTSSEDLSFPPATEQPSTPDIRPTYSSADEPCLRLIGPITAENMNDKLDPKCSFSALADIFSLPPTDPDARPSCSYYNSADSLDDYRSFTPDPGPSCSFYNSIGLPDERPITPDIHPSGSYSDSTEPNSPASANWHFLTSPKTPDGIPKTPGSRSSEDSLFSLGTVSTLFSPEPNDVSLEDLDGLVMPNQPNAYEQEFEPFEGFPQNSVPNSPAQSRPNSPNISPAYSPQDSPYSGSSHASTRSTARSINSPGHRNGFSPGTDGSPLSEDEEEDSV